MLSHVGHICLDEGISQGFPHYDTTLVSTKGKVIACVANITLFTVTTHVQIAADKRERGIYRECTMLFLRESMLYINSVFTQSHTILPENPVDQKLKS